MSDKGSAPPVLSLFLTHDEWLSVWAYYFVAFHWDCYGVEEMSEEDADEIWGSVGASMRWAIARLAQVHGMKFTGIAVDEDGNWHPTRDTYVEPRNAFFIYRLKNGMWPRPDNAIKVAIETFKKQRLDIDLDPLRTALEQVESDIAQARDRLFNTPEGREEMAIIGEAIEKMMTLAGYKRAGRPN